MTLFSPPPYFPAAHIFKKQKHESEDNHLVHLLFHFSSQPNVEQTSQKITHKMFVTSSDPLIKCHLTPAAGIRIYFEICKK